MRQYHTPRKKRFKLRQHTKLQSATIKEYIIHVSEMNGNTEFLNISVEFIPNSSVNKKGKKMLTTLTSNSHSLPPWEEVSRPSFNLLLPPVMDYISIKGLSLAKLHVY